MNRTRGRVHLNERQEERRFLGLGWPETDRDGFELPNPPDNDFVGLLGEERATEIETRFRNGIELGEIYDQRAKRLVREASQDCHRRFNAPSARRTKRKELRAKLWLVARRNERA